jgi:hypothetical protein
VAIGDLHGDLSATRAALRLAAVVDDADQWSGGRTIVVQTGDQIDRGDDDRAVVEWLHALREQAPRSGGAIHLLSGNHELMNVLGDMRYVTAGAFAAFEGGPGRELDAPELASVPPQARARVAAMRPGGPFARRFATQPVVLIVGDSVFAHGGLGAAEVTRGLDAVNAEVRALMEGTAADPAAAAARWMAPDGPLWRRDQSDPDSAVDCAQLRRTLNALGVTRLVVGHTVQAQGVTAACDGAVWRIDVGMSAHYGGPVEVLELVDGQVRVLRAEHP